MIVADFSELIKEVNQALGDFGGQFQEKRKQLFGLKRVPHKTLLFRHTKDRHDWAINIGGSNQIQYHIFLRNYELGYGLGFNTQYVVHHTVESLIHDVQPFASAFLNDWEVRQILSEAGFDYVYGADEELAALKPQNYVLFGKIIQVTDAPHRQGLELTEQDFDTLIKELTGVLFWSYIRVTESALKNKFAMEELEPFLKILEYKPQLILQGPPGTGKTYLAKKIARALTNDLSLNEYEKDEVLACFDIGQVIKTKTGQPLTVDKIDQQNTITVKNSTGTSTPMTIEQIIKSSEGGQSYPSAMAKFAKDRLAGQRIKLVQFHPSYTYEDFVRGINSVTIEGDVHYEVKNKILSEMSLRAMESFDSFQNADQVAEKKWTLKKLAEFADHIQEKIDRGEKHELTNNVVIKDTEMDSFRYMGPRWGSNNAQRMKFDDIARGFMARAESRIEFKKLEGISGLARQHATYYFIVLEQFKTFVNRTFPKRERVGSSEIMPHVLIIDEINRANLPSVLGELIYALEYRGEPVEGIYSIDGSRTLIIPENLYIIGTMNTADRSTGHIDYAIRRRFAFKSILPDQKHVPKGQLKVLFNQITQLFETYKSPDFEIADVQIGHSYFMGNEADINAKWNYEILPLLKEYIADGILQSTAITEIDKLNERFGS